MNRILNHLERFGDVLWTCIRPLFCFMLQMSIFAYQWCTIEFAIESASRQLRGCHVWPCIRSLFCFMLESFVFVRKRCKIKFAIEWVSRDLRWCLMTTFSVVFSVFAYRRCRIKFAIEWKSRRRRCCPVALYSVALLFYVASVYFRLPTM